MTLTSDLSRKNLEKDFERMDTPQGTFYREHQKCLSLSLHLQNLPYSLLVMPILSLQNHNIQNLRSDSESFSALTLILGVYFDILLALDGSEFNAELVCQGEVMGRCTARFK